jgi:hypothetical protein
MLLDTEALVRQITDLQQEAVARWHRRDLDNAYTGLLAVVCQQHQFNFQLWHEEDVARSSDVSDSRIAAVKRAIDRFNQQRNDAIERIDESLLEMLKTAGVVAEADARLNTETPGSAIDRLSIMALRIYHLEEQFDRNDVDHDHRERVAEKLTRCHVQHADLSQSLAELLGDLFRGRKLLKVYRQMKMYNDPTLNPYLYRTQRRVSEKVAV